MELRDKIAESFRIARHEGEIKRFADGYSDADEVLQWVVEEFSEKLAGIFGVNMSVRVPKIMRPSWKPPVKRVNPECFYNLKSILEGE